jgi:hypothetical protein
MGPPDCSISLLCVFALSFTRIVCTCHVCVFERGKIISILDCVEVEFEVEVNLRPIVSRPVCQWGTHLGPAISFPFSLKFPLDSCGFVILWRPLWREHWSVLYLYNCFWALPEQSLLGRSPAELTAIFYCLIWDSPNREGQVTVFISPRNRVAQLYPRALCSLFVASYVSQGLRWRHCNPPPFP